MKLVHYNSANVTAILEEIKSRPSGKIESDTIEFKDYKNRAALNNATKDLAEEICAFANFRGGVIIVGVVDDKNLSSKNWHDQLKGFDVVDEPHVTELLKGRIQNSIEINVENLAYEGKNFLAIFVEKNTEALVITTSGKSYIRDGRSSRPMKSEEIEKTIKSLHNYDWSADSLHDFDLNALDPRSVQEAFAEYCERNEKQLPSTEVFLEIIEATKNGVLTKGGLIFLGKQEQILARLGNLEYRFTWRNGLNLVKNEVWSGNIWCALKLMKEYFADCVSVIEFEYNEKKYRAPNLDNQVFYEAITNAAVHRDYEKEGMIIVEFTGEQLTISSPGDFYGGVNAENIAIHKPRHRNKALARSMMAFGLVDRAGMGVLRMGIASLIYGRSFPRFEEAQDGITVTMVAEYIRSGIFVLTQRKKDLHVPDLLILNILYGRGYIEISDCARLIQKTTTKTPWLTIQQSLSRWSDFIELCGSKEQIGIRVKKAALNFFELKHEHQIARVSDKCVALFIHLKQYKESNNKEITRVMGHAHATQTSKLLKDIRWIYNTGKTTATSWYLGKEYLDI